MQNCIEFCAVDRGGMIHLSSALRTAVMAMLPKQAVTLASDARMTENRALRLLFGDGLSMIHKEEI